MCSIVCSIVRVLEKPLHIPVEINRGIRVAIEAVYELRLGVKRVHVETGAEWRFAPGIHAWHPAPAPDESRDTTNQEQVEAVCGVLVYVLQFAKCLLP